MKRDKRQPSPTFLENLSRYFSQYCDNTSIHGMKYLGERGRFVIEKLVWFIVITTVCSLCIFLILKAYDKWVTQPVIVTFATQETPIWNIPFPAVTVCPEVKCDPAKFNYSDFIVKRVNGLPATPEELELFMSMTLVCPALSEVGVFEDQSATRLTELPYDNLEKVFPDHREDKLSSATWMGETLPMSELTTIYTSEGVCYTFNMLKSDDILRSQDDTPAEDVPETIPKSTFISGIAGGFELFLYTNHNNLDYLCGQFLQGFKVMVHHPSEWPNMDRHLLLPLDQVLQVGLKPRMVTVGDELKSYKSEDRECYFPDERPLLYFRNYTQENCLSECLSNYTLKSCTCLPFYMEGNLTNTTVCGPGSFDCVKKSKVNFLFQNGKGSDQKLSCDCLPSCTSLEYDVETSQNALDWRQTLRMFSEIGRQPPPLDYKRDHFSYLMVYYKEMQFLSSERHELYGYVDFFSSTGGLLGLFIGISVTSGLEILYYLTLRLGCNIKKFGKRFWSGDAELIEATTTNED